MRGKPVLPTDKNLVLCPILHRCIPKDLVFGSDEPHTDTSKLKYHVYPVEMEDS